jgi:hypothetical protein
MRFMRSGPPKVGSLWWDWGDGGNADLAFIDRQDAKAVSPKR